MFLQNVGIYLRVYTALHTTQKTNIDSSPLCEHRISYNYVVDRANQHLLRIITVINKPNILSKKKPAYFARKDFITQIPQYLKTNDGIFTATSLALCDDEPFFINLHFGFMEG
jgi:hypothetical protein